jgi:hypothetical protein
VVGAGVDGGGDARRPVRLGLRRCAVDEVEVHDGDAGTAGRVDGAGRGLGVVASVEEVEHARRPRLRADAHPGEPGPDEGGHALGGDVLGVRLGRDLGVVGEREDVPRQREDAGEVGGVEQRRGPAADEDAPEGRPVRRDVGVRRGDGGRAGLGDADEVGPQRGDVGGDGVVHPRVGVEVAVPADVRAEGHVEVEAGAGHGRQRRRGRRPPRAASPRRPTARRRTPPGGSPPHRRSSCASSPPSASRGACACG